jgi:hypothetical protein
VGKDTLAAYDAIEDWVIDATGEPAGVKVEPKQEEGR